MNTLSPLQKARYAYQPKLPAVLQGDIKNISCEMGEPTEAISHQAELKGLFTKTYGNPIARFVKGSNPRAGEKINLGVILSGGQAPGGHNVIAGIFDGLKKSNPESKLYGFLGGPAGIMNEKLVEIDNAMMDAYRNTGGFDIIGSGRDKLESEAQFEQSLATCRKYGISGVVIIGGDDSNTNGAVLAEYFAAQNSGITVIGCPKTIDGDLKNEFIETSFGFDTATKTYSELIGNIEKDANSAKKYWHFIKLMGRSASHIGLECALQTQPNICIISEEVEARKMTLKQVVDQIVDVVVQRSARGMNFGVALIPEGLIEFIPEVGALISELNDKMAQHADYFSTLKTLEDQQEWLNQQLSRDSSYVFSALPRSIQEQLLMDRDPHGNVQVSRIETEKLLIEMVGQKLTQMKMEGDFKGSFSALAHFFGYEGRCAFPSKFDSDYCYTLGYSAFILMSHGLTGYISNVVDLQNPAAQWVPGGCPLTMMMNMERRHGSMKPVIKKALVELEGAPFKAFAAQREVWAVETAFTFPGAIQYYGPDEVCNQPTETLKYEKA
ncbi:diphosphate--fructose-6-phosphate 1-phosphotransferase [Oceanispirochaeta sp.]|jgi:pyrophosphate--fructose-6-phosphate 1-phosphotransferase|uniref:diphosphate--fructose-6-phosphate 1-phosphotransferase n=1 Tax=Oceanispirochaeta sp. TaxID=2035350 RepID=UPI002606E70E|nr:diphosphate--fructose-6-phosphate 1-phosphotransferase [Oceanispirochaeta sp.]MDA3956969.1 diphosphate--fructose-6-phosphate 1-phosphotransferase [Oceanispirochaeta sp.]